MFFYIAVIILAIMYLILLELSKNILIGWAVGILAAVLMMVLKNNIISRFFGKFPVIFIMWCAFFIILVINYNLTAPPYKRVSAVANISPEITAPVTINQGTLTGVYNEDKSVKVYAGIPYAAPPVGDLRFREPAAPQLWDGTITV